MAKPRSRRAGGAASPLTLMLVDDHPLWRDMLRRVLERRGHGRVMAEASHGEEAVERARGDTPEIVVMDIDLPGMNGVEATRRLVSEHPGIRVLVLSASDDRSQVMAAVRAGASGYLLKTAGSSEIADAVRRVHAGELVFPPSLAAVVLDELRRKDAPIAPDVQNAFVREGDYWTLAFGGEATRVRDTKGMRAIAYLLAIPGEEVHVGAVSVALEGHGAPSDPARLAAEGLRTNRDDLGPVLDTEAKRVYRERLRQLETELEEAKSWNDPERAARARQEMDALVTQLSSAIGLGGRDRKEGSASERARVNVTKRIKTALERIREVHPSMGRHLAASIRTGTFLSYEPPEDTQWVL